MVRCYVQLDFFVIIVLLGSVITYLTPQGQPKHTIQHFSIALPITSHIKKLIVIIYLQY